MTQRQHYISLATFFIGLVLLIPNLVARNDLSLPTQCKLQGKVIKVTDGDTVNVLDNKKVTHKVRLAGIDAPERGQPFGKASTKYLSKLINQKNICVNWNKKDRYKRLVGVIRINDLDVNLKMVRAGLAWHYKKYQQEQTELERRLYADSEVEARKQTLGLWSMPNPISPSDWRAGTRKPINPSQTLQSYTCGTKQFCTQMLDCKEACFYLHTCSISRLDGNKDGIPCNQICHNNCPK